MSIIDNKIHIEQRFAKRGEQEYNVFSTTLEDPESVDNWVGISQPHYVLMDPETYKQLRNRKIQWVFDKDKVIIGCKMSETECKRSETE